VKDPKMYFEKISVARMKKILAQQGVGADSSDNAQMGRTSQDKPRRHARPSVFQRGTSIMNAPHKSGNSQTSSSASSARTRGLKPEANSSKSPQSRHQAADGVPRSDDWRELARLVQNEKDPHKMIELVQALITRFDKERSEKDLRKKNDLK